MRIVNKEHCVDHVIGSLAKTNLGVRVCVRGGGGKTLKTFSDWTETGMGSTHLIGPVLQFQVGIHTQVYMHR